MGRRRVGDCRQDVLELRGERPHEPLEHRIARAVRLLPVACAAVRAERAVEPHPGHEYFGGVGLRPVHRGQKEERTAARLGHDHARTPVESAAVRAVGVVRHRHGLRAVGFRHAAEANLLHACRRFDVRHQRVRHAMEAHLRALGGILRVESAALRDQHPRPLAVAHREIVPARGIGGKAELDVGILRHERHDGGRHGRERQTSLARVETLRRVGEHLHATFPPRLEGERLELFPVGGEARQLDPAHVLVGAARASAAA